MKVKAPHIVTSALLLLSGAAFIFGQEPAAPTKPSPAEQQIRETLALRQQVHELTLQNEQAQIQNMTLQMQQLNTDYNAVVAKMLQENPGMTWNAAQQRLEPKAPPQIPAKPAETPKSAPPAPAPKPAAK